MPTLSAIAPPPSSYSDGGSVTCSPVMAAASCAMPSTERQSPAVRRDLHLKRAGRREHVNEWRADRAVVRQHEDALVLVAQPEFALGADHARGLDAAYDRRGQLHRLAGPAVREHRAHPRERDLLPRRDVRRAADDGGRLAAHVDVGQAQPVSVGVRAHIEDMADDDLIPPPAGAGS